MSPNLKLSKLKNTLLDLESVVIAFSGGVDSTFLAKVAYETLGERALAVTASSETYTPKELEEAKELADKIGINHLVIHTEELSNESFVQNPPERCYHCKKELFSKLFLLAKEKGLNFVLDGANADDVGDFRPGLTAGKELGVRSPLKETGLTKNDIRELSKEMGLPTWDKPSAACLSSRFPYGDPITKEKLQQVQLAESCLRELGFVQFRVRHHGKIARIEIPVENFKLLIDESIRNKILDKFKDVGFGYITLDLSGFSSGSMNLVLDQEVIDGYRIS